MVIRYVIVPKKQYTYWYVAMSEIQDRVKLRSSWKAKIGGEFEQEYMQNLRRFLIEEKQAGKIIYPEGDNIFSSMNLVSFDDVKVVIIGQDPYHGEGQAHGLCFSVKPGVRIPPSLQNIFKEIQGDLGIPIGNHGYLKSWAEQGVLLLNSVLTVEKNKAGSHQGKGWERFTDAIIEKLNKEHTGLVFLLWGSYAQKKGRIIDQKRHLVLQSVHPSPLSAHRGFFGNHHFSRTNAYLERQGKSVINWAVPALQV
ncbi:Uracil-DNA glycosylase [Desulfocapsa sulfexigens DSM 10523]|uniref:Uracil-DNA glycosylase n=2 Tax=Desulfocapsa TaxID=53318 RepID=M1P3R6_DESSD|nr:Uracil-DNA glycosylase [Desulfocapsa sulfexigens DSM 10523]